ncbi:Transcription factor spt8 [Boothiomyces macroporosus]|uniref:Transcription factor spt8 n=1 Tax=Boothiomyces macroporosus TaxID=261099 RepID=A0AAD5ULF3_9FUNG|nr:Transcription factor spt8 [Boothiomyces macroporosus]
MLGFIRKYDTIASVNGGANLTGAQKHGLVDTIQKGGALISAWENEDGPGPTPEDPPKISPVYSMDVHSEAVWLVTGNQTGNINLWTVRHEEGKLQHVLKGHKNVVSALQIAPEERSLVSGSWDKLVKLWDLDDGSVITEYSDLSTHITALEFHPNNTNVFLANCYDGSIYIYDIRKKDGFVKKIPASISGAPAWSMSACWSADGSKMYVGRRNASVDEIDYASGSLLQTLKLPNSSGRVSSVGALPSRHLLIASHDNLRLWDLEHLAQEVATAKPVKPNADQAMFQTENNDLFPSFANDSFNMDFFSANNEPIPKPEEKSADVSVDQDLLAPLVPFSIIPGHHGGLISAMRNL